MLSVAPPLRPDLEVLHQASAGDLAAVDLLHVDVLGTEEPRHQHLQVAQEIAVDLWMEKPKRRQSRPVSFAHRGSSFAQWLLARGGETKWEVSVRRRQAVGRCRPPPALLLSSFAAPAVPVQFISGAASCSFAPDHLIYLTFNQVREEI